MKACIRCNSEMVEGLLSAAVRVQPKTKGLKNIFAKSSNIEAYVCPNCGYVELYAEDLKRIHGEQE
ncbi:hypothetical protein D3C71_1495850 [compost metagenome]